MMLPIETRADVEADGDGAKDRPARTECLEHPAWSDGAVMVRGARKNPAGDCRTQAAAHPEGWP